MVTFQNVGRMGNFLFEAATSLAYSLDHTLEYTVPSATSRPEHNPIYLTHLINPKYDPRKRTVFVTQEGFKYQTIPFKEEWRNYNIILRGYWQSEKFFMHRRNQILESFGFPWHPYETLVSVHVRRGDYLQLTQKHPPVTKEWYQEAMNLPCFYGFKFIFFSDDIQWCADNFQNDNRCLFFKDSSPEATLCEMSRCAHHICSASTFAWWGMWLNRNPQKIAVFPKLWFQPGRQEDTSDIIPEWCIRL